MRTRDAILKQYYQPTFTYGLAVGSYDAHSMAERIAQLEAENDDLRGEIEAAAWQRKQDQREAYYGH